MRFETEDGPLEVEIKRAFVAGWTGRDEAAVRDHIEELAMLDVPAPSTTPLYYRISPGLIVQTGEIAVLGEETSGEAEPFVLKWNGVTGLGLASDHTDRGLEVFSVAHSKMICPKPVATSLWRLNTETADALTLRSWIDGGAGWAVYQDGELAEIRPLAELIAGAGLEEGDAMLCGTLPARGGIRPAPRFRMELGDPASGRVITADYAVRTIPVVA
ncbi:MAG: DUF2848 family protein [Pseudomonadota bacterium]